MNNMIECDEYTAFVEQYVIVKLAIRSQRGQKALAMLDEFFIGALQEMESLNSSRQAKQEIIEARHKRAEALTTQITHDRGLLTEQQEQIKTLSNSVARHISISEAIHNLHIDTMHRIAGR